MRYEKGKAGRSITPATDFPGFSSSINQEEAAIYNQTFMKVKMERDFTGGCKI